MWEPAWSWALRRARSIWASASLELGEQRLGHRVQPRGARSAPTRERCRARWRSLSRWYDAPASTAAAYAASAARTCSRGLLRGARPVPDAGDLEHHPGPADVGDRVGVGRGDRDAAVGLAGGQALGRPAPPRASRRVDRETPSESASATSRSGVPGLQLAVEDRAPQLVGDPVHGGGVAQVQGVERPLVTLRVGHGGILPHAAWLPAGDSLRRMSSPQPRPNVLAIPAYVPGKPPTPAGGTDDLQALVEREPLPAAAGRPRRRGRRGRAR